MENTCRICLLRRRNLQTIFYSFNSETPYSEMIMNITNLKIYPDDKYPDKICLICRNKLTEAYIFKQFIENNENKLRQEFGVGKKINFNNFKDLKVELGYVKMEPDVKNEDFNIDFNDCNVFHYKDVEIKKAIKNEPSDSKEKEMISVEEFLDSIENNYDDNDNYHETYSDDEYVPENVKKKAPKKYKKDILKNKTPLSSHAGNKSIKPIKPIFMRDLRLIPTYKKTGPRSTTIKKKYKKKMEVCPYCGKLISSLDKHILIHTGERKYKCSECPKSYFIEKQLAKHMVKHGGVKQYNCDKCLASFYDMAALRSHQESHSDIKNQICNICNKGFIRKKSLAKHLLRHSSANKTVKCELCNMSFFEKYNLKHHMRVHTRERPYNCELCAQPYSYKHDFNRHCLKKHGVFFKRRSVYVMNAEVLAQERLLMKELAQRTGNPFEGPQAVLAYEYTLKALENKQIAIADT